MGAGNWSVGLIIDERASTEQEKAITGIASGQAGGPMAALGPLIGKFLGVEKRPITFQKDGMRRAISIPGLTIDNTLHPANARLALARAQQSHLQAFGLDWDDTSGRHNGHFARFTWQG